MLSPLTISFIRASVVTIPSIALEVLTDCTLAIFSNSLYTPTCCSSRFLDNGLKTATVRVHHQEKNNQIYAYKTPLSAYKLTKNMQILLISA